MAEEKLSKIGKRILDALREFNDYLEGDVAAEAFSLHLENAAKLVERWTDGKKSVSGESKEKVKTSGDTISAGDWIEVEGNRVYKVREVLLVEVDEGNVVAYEQTFIFVHGTPTVYLPRQVIEVRRAS